MRPLRQIQIIIARLLRLSLPFLVNICESRKTLPNLRICHVKFLLKHLRLCLYALLKLYKLNEEHVEDEGAKAELESQH